MSVLPYLCERPTSDCFKLCRSDSAVGLARRHSSSLGVGHSSKQHWLARAPIGMAIPASMTGGQLSRRASSYNGQDIRIAAPNIDLDEFPGNLKHDCLLYYFPECEALADKIAGLIPDKVTLGKIKWR